MGIIYKLEEFDLENKTLFSGLTKIVGFADYDGRMNCHENKDKEEDYKKLFREIGNPNTMNQKEQFETLIEKMKKV